VNISQATEAFFTAITAEGAKPVTVTWYRNRLARFLHQFKDTDLSQLNLDDLRAFLVSLQDGSMSPHTLFAVERVIRRLLKWLYEEHKIPEPYYKQVKLPRLPKAVPKGVDMDDFVRLLGTCENNPIGYRDRAILMFLLDTGCRVGGLTKMKLGELDLPNGRARVHEKGDKERVVLFGKPTAAAVQNWLSRRPYRDSPTVFISMRDGNPMNDGSVYQMLDRRKTQACVQGRANPHAFRHAFAREWRNPVADDGALVGHAD
jgi:site-specific recombinase XerC